MKTNFNSARIGLLLLSFLLTVSAFNAQAQVTILSQNFESVSPPSLPSGWTTENPNGGFVFLTGDSMALNTGGFWAIDPHGTFAFANDDACNCDMSEVRLILPPVDLTGFNSVSISAEVWLDNVYGSAPFEQARIEVSINNGLTWSPIGSTFPPLAAWQDITVDLSDFDGTPNLLIAFRYDDNGNWGRGLAVDDVFVEGFPATGSSCFFSENFQSVTTPALPPGWTTNNPNGGFQFLTGDSTAANSGGFWAIDPNGIFAFTSDDACNCDMSEVRLILPPQDFSSYTGVQLNAEVWLDNVYGSAPFETARVEVSTNGGSTWVGIAPDFPPLEAWQELSVNLSAYDGLSNVLIAFRYDDNGNWGRGLAVDNVCLEGFSDEVCVFSEAFNSVVAPALPPGWSTENPNGGFVFQTGDSTAANSGGFWAIDPHGQFAFTSDDACNCDMSEVRLIFPEQNFSGVIGLTLNADVWLDNVYGSVPFETAWVEVSLNGGGSWAQVGPNFTPLEAWQDLVVDLSDYDNTSNVLIAFHYNDNGNWGRGLAVDDICISGLTNVDCSINEGFETAPSPALPAGWTTTNPNGGFQFMTGDSTAVNSGGFWAIDPHGQMAFASDDACNCNMSEVRLILPPQNFSGESEIFLSADVWLDNVYGSAPFETARVEVSTNSGASWSALGPDFPPLEAWQNINRDLSALAGQPNVWIAFRYDDNGNWGRGLAVDDVLICSADPGTDLEMTSVSRLNEQYTIVPEDHETAAIFQGTVTNVGSAATTGVYVESDFFLLPDLVTPITTLTGPSVNLGPGDEYNFNTNPGNLIIGATGDWAVSHRVYANEDDSNPSNDKLFSPIFTISDGVYARDDRESTDQGGFGIGGGVNDNGKIGQNFELYQTDYVSSVQVILDTPDPGMEVSVEIFACDDDGIPFGDAIAQSEMQIAVGAGSDEEFTLGFYPPVELDASTHLFAIREDGPNIGIKGWSSIYTPGDNSGGTNWVRWDGVADWTEPTTLVPSFGVAYSIRPNFSGCPGDFNGDGAIGTTDLLQLLAQFGCTSNCQANMTGDPSVTVQDMLAFLTLFGTFCD